MNKVRYEKVSKINVSQRLLSNSRHNVSLEVNVNLENNVAFYVLTTREGSNLYYSLKSAVEKYNEIINPKKSKEWSCPQPVNKFSFNDAIFEHEAGIHY